MPEHDQPRRLGTATRDAEQESHAERLDGVLVQNLDRQAGLCASARRPLGEDARRQDIPRLVGERARSVGTLAEHPGPIRGGLQGTGITPGHDDDVSAFERARRGLTGLAYRWTRTAPAPEPRPWTE